MPGIKVEKVHTVNLTALNVQEILADWAKRTQGVDIDPRTIKFNCRNGLTYEEQVRQDVGPTEATLVGVTIQKIETIEQSVEAVKPTVYRGRTEPDDWRILDNIEN